MPVSFISLRRLMSVVMTDKANRASEGTFDRECSVDAAPATRPERDDATAFDKLVAVHFQDVNRLVNRLLGWSDGADDVVQEVFLSVLEEYREVSRRQQPFDLADADCRQRMPQSSSKTSRPVETAVGCSRAGSADAPGKDGYGIERLRVV